MPRELRLSRSIRYAGYFAILFGATGVAAGVVGAATFVPYGAVDNLSVGLENALTAISAAGAFVSLLGVISGWGLLRARRWAWWGSTGVALASIATVAILAAAWPPSSPFLGVVAFFYGLEVVLLLLGLGTFRARAKVAAPG